MRGGGPSTHAVNYTESSPRALSAEACDGRYCGDMHMQAGASNSRLDQIRGSILKVQQLMGCTLLSTTSGGRVVLSIQEHLEKLNADIERLHHRVDTALSMRQAPSSHSAALRPSPPASPARNGGIPANLLTSSQQTQQARACAATLHHTCIRRCISTNPNLALPPVGARVGGGASALLGVAGLSPTLHRVSLPRQPHLLTTPPHVRLARWSRGRCVQTLGALASNLHADVR